MTKWVPVGDGFIEADVIRWTEPVYKKQPRGKPVRVGKRLVTAEVLEADRDGWTHLLVRGAKAVSANFGWNLRDVLLPPKDEETKRKRTTITRGGAERLLWSDESARALVASRFLNERDTAPPVSTAKLRRPPRSARHSSSGKHKRRVRNPGWKPPRPRF